MLKVLFESSHFVVSSSSKNDWNYKDYTRFVVAMSSLKNVPLTHSKRRRGCRLVLIVD